MNPTAPLRVAGKSADPLIQGSAMLDLLSRDEGLALLDGVVALGGRSFDLAHDYGAGTCERRFGEWLAAHGGAEAARELFLVTKGGHPDARGARIRRDAVRADLEESLTRLGVDAVDLFLLHRDDERVPVGEIVAFLDELCREGLTRAYGGSNWRVERLAAAQAYARAHGLAPMAASSPHFSLAVPVDEPWPGTVSIAGDPDAQAWHLETGLPVLAWSSLAMGWFELDEGAAVGGRERTIGARVFASAENAARRERVRRLAALEGDTPTQIVARYVLGHELPLHALVGCRSAAEHAALRAAAERPLPRARLRWLERGGAPDPPPADP